MRIKVRLDITKPLMRGITIFVDDEDENKEEEEEDIIIEDGDGENNKKKESSRDVTFKYEHLPDFCYICGVIGHSDRICSSKEKLGSKHKFGLWLKVNTWMKSPSEEDRSRGSQDRAGFWSNSSGGSKGSDAISWTKIVFGNDDSRGSHKGEEKGASSILKIQKGEDNVELNVNISNAGEDLRARTNNQLEKSPSKTGKESSPQSTPMTTESEGRTKQEET